LIFAPRGEEGVLHAIGQSSELEVFNVRGVVCLRPSVHQ
jgi:hypothetical protein